MADAKQRRPQAKGAKKAASKAADKGGAKRATKRAGAAPAASSSSRSKAAPSSRKGGSQGRGGGSRKGGSQGQGGGSRKGGSQREGGGSSASSRRNGGMPALEVAREARRQLQALLGRPVEAVLGMDRERGSWTVTVQVVELERIPNTTDVLGEYEAVLTRNGDVESYRRTHRYHRGHTDGQG